MSVAASGLPGKIWFGCTPGPRRSLVGACLVHALHDGYADLLYVLLPLWQKEFGLSYAALAIVRCLYYGTMGGLQVPADRLTRGLGCRRALAWATATAACGYAVSALPGGLSVLCAGLVIGGIGSSLQHPQASLLVSQAYGTASRRPLGIYNFAGDLGKASFPPFLTLLLIVTTWRRAIEVTALIGLLVALSLLLLLPREPPVSSQARSGQPHPGARVGFRMLLVIGGLDTSTRMGFLLFLPFLLHGKGGGETTIGFGFAALFGGGAFGKAICGWIGDRFGIVASVIATEVATTALIVLVLLLPLGPVLALLPALGVVLNGTSSVLYATVPELAPDGDAGRAFAVFYTAVIGSGALAPVVYGILGDHAGQTSGVIASGLTALATVPLVVAMRRQVAV